MPPRSVQARRFRGTCASLRDPIAQTLQAAGFAIVSYDPGGAWFRGNSSMSLMSWGENITVTVQEADGGSVVTIESKSRFPLTLVDWGRNGRNVNKLFDQLARLAASEAA